MESEEVIVDWFANHVRVKAMDNVTILTLLLIGIGVLLLVLELVIPSGTLLVAGIIAILAGVAVPFVYGKTSMGLTTLIVVLIVLPVLLVGLLHLWPRTPVGRRMFLAGTDEDQTVASMPVLLELEQLRGRLGRAISPLRPSGTADIDGRRVDVLTEGLMIEEGAWVRVVDVRAGKVIVRPANPPQLTDLENLEI